MGFPRLRLTLGISDVSSLQVTAYFRLISTMVFSSGVSSKKSETVPTFQPLDSSKSRLACSIASPLLVNVVMS
jgi:hypothetical protein